MPKQLRKIQAFPQIPAIQTLNLTFESNYDITQYVLEKAGILRGTYDVLSKKTKTEKV